MIDRPSTVETVNSGNGSPALNLAMVGPSAGSYSPKAEVRKPSSSFLPESATAPLSMTIHERRLAAMIGFAAMVLVEACSRRGPTVSVPSTPMLPPASPAPALEMRGNQAVKPGVLERFRALKARHDSGELTDSEYETKRQQLSDEVMQGK